MLSVREARQLLRVSADSVDRRLCEVQPCALWNAVCLASSLPKSFV